MKKNLSGCYYLSQMSFFEFDIMRFKKKLVVYYFSDEVWVDFKKRGNAKNILLLPGHSKRRPCLLVHTPKVPTFGSKEETFTMV